MKRKVLLAICLVCSAALFACTQEVPATKAPIVDSVDTTVTVIAPSDTPSPTESASGQINQPLQRPLLLPMESLLAEVDDLVQRMEEEAETDTQEVPRVLDADTFVDLSDEEAERIIGYTPDDYKLINVRRYEGLPGKPLLVWYLGPMGAQLRLLEHPFGVEGRRLPIEFTEEIPVGDQTAFITRGNLAEQRDSTRTTVIWDQSARLGLIFWREGKAYELYVEPADALHEDELVKVAESVRGPITE